MYVFNSLSLAHRQQGCNLPERSSSGTSPCQGASGLLALGHQTALQPDAWVPFQTEKSPGEGTAAQEHGTEQAAGALSTVGAEAEAAWPHPSSAGRGCRAARGLLLMSEDDLRRARSECDSGMTKTAEVSEHI